MIEQHFETRSKKGRGMAQSVPRPDRSDARDREGRAADHRPRHRLQAVHAGLIPSMATAEMQQVYRLLKEAREQGMIPWEWIVDETRELERVPSWDDPAAFVRTVSRAYRRDFWDQQPSARRGVEREGHRARRARTRCSTSTASASGSCTASAARPPSTMLPKMTMGAR